MEHHSTVISLVRLISFDSIDPLRAPRSLAYYWSPHDLLAIFFLITSVDAFSRMAPTIRTRYSEERFLVIKADAYRVPTYVYLWDGMEWRTIPGQCAHPTRVNNFIRFAQSFPPSLFPFYGLRTDVVIGLLRGTRESTSFGIIASDESTTVRATLSDGYSYVCTYLVRWWNIVVTVSRIM